MKVGSGKAVRRRRFLGHGHRLRHREQTDCGVVRGLWRWDAQRSRGHEDMAMSSSPTRSSHVVAHHGRAGRIGRRHGPRPGIPVDPEIRTTSVPFSFNLNGIVALKGGRSLIVVQTHTASCSASTSTRARLTGARSIRSPWSRSSEAMAC